MVTPWWDEPERANVLTRLAYLLFALSLLLAWLGDRAFFGDGVAYFIGMLDKRGLSVEWPVERGFAETLFMAPAALALWLGVTDFDLLRLLFGLGCLLPWPAALWLCHRLAPRQAWIAVLAAGAGYLNSGYFVFGQYNVAQACYLPVLLILLFVRPLHGFAAAVLLGACVILLRSYESLLFLGPLAALLALWRVWREREAWPWRLVLLAAAGLLAAAAAIAYRGVSQPRSPGNYDNFLRGAWELLLAPTWTVICTALLLLLLALLATSQRLRARLAAWRLWFWCLPAVALAWGGAPLLNPHRFLPILQYKYRAIALAVPLALTLLALLLRHRPALLEPRRGLFVSLAALLLALQSLWHIAGTGQWIGYQALYRATLAEGAGPLRFEDTPLARRGQGLQSTSLGWPWTHPFLSLAWNDHGTVRSILYQTLPNRQQHLDPFDVQGLPALGRYGIDYGPYLEALKAAPTEP